MRSTETRPWRLYAGWEVFLHNLPYILMICLGAALIWQWPGPWWAVAYLVYGAVGACWIMLFVCPYCRFWGTRACPCGYGVLAERLRPKASCEAFERQFRRHIPVIVPLWFIPLAAAAVLLWGGLDWSMVILACCFCADAFLVLPLVSAHCGCKDCPQRQSCPWMSRLGADKAMAVESQATEALESMHRSSGRVV